MYSSLSFFFFLVLVTGCQTDKVWDREAVELMELQTFLQKEQSRLLTSVDSLWDATSSALEKEMPPDIPPVDREIFLRSRNADHMRMFMSFQNLDKELQHLVYITGEFDKMFANKLRTLSQKQKEFEKRKMMFLQKVAQRDTQTYQHYAVKFRSQHDLTEI